MQRLNISTRSRAEFVDITSQVAGAIRAEGAKEGVCCVCVTHTTAGITINENADPSVPRDILGHLEKLVPRDDGYAHSEGNSDAHIKASMMGFSVMVPVSGGELQLGTWQGIFFCEFDGPRRRTVIVRMV